MKRNKKLLIVLLLLTPAIIYIIYFTDSLSIKYSYVRLKNGTEFRDVPVKRVDDIGFRINGNYYTEFDIDSLAY
tara:strand:- start:2317 stop:2538 length:222 start_codon:yes stop_codon:yes gene_type:complete